MTYYLIFLGIVMMLAAAYDKNPWNRKYYFAILLVMTLFAGLRADWVGTDSAGYARKFLVEEELEEDIVEKATDEGGFYYLKYFLGKISKQYWVLFTGIALLTYYCVLRSIRSQSNKLLIPLFVFITLGLYTFVFNAARQGIAVGIYMLSFQYLFKDFRYGFPRYCLIVLLAATFHKTVIIALPLFFLFRLNYSGKILILNALGGLIIGASISTLFAFAGEINQRYLYYQTETSGGQLLTVFYILITIFFISWRRNIDPDKKRRYDVFLNMMIFGTMIYIMVQLTNVYVEMTRFAAYFQVAAIFLWTFIYQSKKKPSHMFSMLIVIAHLIFYTIFCTRMAALVPYSFNPTIF